MAEPTLEKEAHLERTATEPRQAALHKVIVHDIHPVGQTIRIVRLYIPTGDADIHFRPGQWVDTYCPGVAKAGGFTLASAPSRAISNTGNHDSRYLELAVRQSPENPAAEWLWQPVRTILGEPLQVRVGGSFVFPPPSAPLPFGARVVFVAGGVGINPLMSMLSYLGEQRYTNTETEAPTVDVLYSTRIEHPLGDEEGDDQEDDQEKEDGGIASRMLFLERLVTLFARERLRGQLRLFVTGGDLRGLQPDGIPCNEVNVPYEQRRITTADLDIAARGDLGLCKTFAYVCGVPSMTDAFVAHLMAPPETGGLGLPASNVLAEKWW